LVVDLLADLLADSNWNTINKNYKNYKNY